MFHVLVNAENPHSLWPVFAPVPDGWTVVVESRGREECLDHINTSWTDMRPLSLVRQMPGDELEDVAGGRRAEPSPNIVCPLLASGAQGRYGFARSRTPMSLPQFT